MITQPKYWKLQILDCASQLRDKASQKQWTEISIGYLERIVMTACYSSRKLYESGHIEKDIFYSSISMTVHKSLGNKINENNWRKLDLLYCLDNADKIEKDFCYVCNQIIHSYVFMPVLKGKNDKGLAGIAFNSDKSSKKYLFYLELWTLIGILGECGNGYIGKPTIFNVGPNGELNLAL